MDKKNKEQRQKALDSLSPEDLEKIKKHQASTKSPVDVDNEWLLLTEFAMLFGWEAYLAVKNDQMTMNEMLTMIEAAQKINTRKNFEMSVAVLIAVASANAKKPSATFAKLTKDYIKDMKADV